MTLKGDTGDGRNCSIFITLVENDSIQSEQFDGAGEGTLGRARSWEEQGMGRVESIGSSLVRKRSWVGESMWVFFFFSVKKVINSQ